MGRPVGRALKESDPPAASVERFAAPSRGVGQAGDTSANLVESRPFRTSWFHSVPPGSIPYLLVPSAVRRRYPQGMSDDADTARTPPHGARRQNRRTSTDVSADRRELPNPTSTPERSFTLPQCLTIAGSDSGGGAGIQADLKTFQANGTFGLSVLTSITAQNTQAVMAAHDLPVDIIQAQLEAVWCDFEIAALKTGMLSSVEIVRAVTGFLRTHDHRPPLVVDPVMISKSGFPLLAEDAVDAVRRELLPLATVVAPNRHEAELLAGLAISGTADLLILAGRILDLGPDAVLIKGGHLEEEEAADYLFRRSAAGEAHLVRRYASPRWATRSTHGTGCTLSAAICAHLGHGRSLEDAVGSAKEYVSQAIRFGLDIGSGHGPTDHFFFLRDGFRSDRKDS